MTAARKALKALDRLQASTDPSDDFTAINLASSLSAPLAAVVRAAMEYREDGYLGADGMQHHTPEACAAFHAALDAFNAAALAHGFQP